jgi:Ca2+/Na+ antiporter
MNYAKERARDKFRFRSRLVFYIGLTGWAIWLVIALSGSENQSLNAIGGLAIITAVIGTYAGAPMIIRARYDKGETTPWKAPGVVALSIFVFILLFGFIPDRTVSLIVGWVSLILIPVFLYMLVWSLVLLVKTKREQPPKRNKSDSIK